VKWNSTYLFIIKWGTQYIKAGDPVICISRVICHRFSLVHKNLGYCFGHHWTAKVYTYKYQHGPQIIWAPLNSQSLHLQMKFNVLLVRHTSDYIYQSCKHICLYMYDHHTCTLYIVVRSMYNFVNCLQFNIRYEKVERPVPVGGALVNSSVEVNSAYYFHICLSLNCRNTHTCIWAWIHSWSFWCQC
jgi:hypothetical protein